MRDILPMLIIDYCDLCHRSLYEDEHLLMRDTSPGEAYDIALGYRVEDTRLNDIRDHCCDWGHFHSLEALRASDDDSLKSILEALVPAIDEEDTGPFDICPPCMDRIWGEVG